MLILLILVSNRHGFCRSFNVCVCARNLFNSFVWLSCCLVLELLLSVIITIRCFFVYIFLTTILLLLVFVKHKCACVVFLNCIVMVFACLIFQCWVCASLSHWNTNILWCAYGQCPKKTFTFNSHS